MKLYMAWPSGYSQKVIAAFYEKEVDVELIPVNLMDADAKAEYKKIHPIGKVPFLVDGDWMVPESSIIVEYLENNYPDQGTKLIPDDPSESRRVRFMDRMNDLYLHNSIGTIFWDGRKPPEKQNPDAVSQAKEYLDVCYNWLNHQMADNEWQFGDKFTLADLSVITPLLYGQMVYPYSDYPNIIAYHQRLQERPSVKKMMAQAMPVIQQIMG